MFFLKEFTKIISGKSVVIIGSGPNPILPENINDPDTVVICVKASGHVAKKLGVKDPDISFQAEWAFDDNLELLRDLKAKHTFQVWETQGDPNFYYKKYKDTNFDYGNLQLFPNHLLPAFYIIDDNFKDTPKDPMSYGVGVILICTNLNAKDITLVGFNPFSRERSYESNRPVLAAHGNTDSYLITNLHKKSYVKISICDKELAKKLEIDYRK